MRIAIIGAGAAGCFAAANIPYQSGREVALFEKTARVLQKVKISGGGRCNVTHQLFDIPELLKKYPRGKNFLKKTLYQFTPRHTIDWFESRGVKIKAESDGRMFPVTDSSQSIIDCIWSALQRNKTMVYYHKAVEKIEKQQEQFKLYFSDKTAYVADKVLITCGGFPKAEHYDWLLQLGHSFKTPVPSLFTFNLPKHPITELMGVSVAHANVKILNTKISEEGPVLITHWGLSGPAVLRTSAWGAREIHELNYHFKARINWMGDVTENELKERINDKRKYEGRTFVNDRNDWNLPRRLWEFLLKEAGIEDRVRWGDMKVNQQNNLMELLLRHTFEVQGKTTYKEEFVTSGGIELSEVHPETMESKRVPGLYFAGEILNVDGITGGFNFQHAWSSAWHFAQNFQ
ncbi:MAG TPA: NAD(P)/FAD-dependent oxidoreductase [Flavipsychrobacter sp.]|nr:NAD(P)/FAD-dependent oxidoreductase [Flavipsychrobacter sp.]